MNLPGTTKWRAYGNKQPSLSALILPVGLILHIDVVVKWAFFKRIHQLLYITFWEIGFPQPGAFGPGIPWQIVCTEDHIDKGKYSSKVFTIVFGILAMVPVMILRCSKNIFQKAK